MSGPPLLAGRCECCAVRYRVADAFLYAANFRDGEYIHVALGSLVDAPTIRPTEHIFVGSKAPWFEITDDLPQHQGHVGAQ